MTLKSRGVNTQLTSFPTSHVKGECSFLKKDARWYLVCMQNNTPESMDAPKQFCPNTPCPYGAPPSMKDRKTHPFGAGCPSKQTPCTRSPPSLLFTNIDRSALAGPGPWFRDGSAPTSCPRYRGF